MLLLRGRFFFSCCFDVTLCVWRLRYTLSITTSMELHITYAIRASSASYMVVYVIWKVVDGYIAKWFSGGSRMESQCLMTLYCWFDIKHYNNIALVMCLGILYTFETIVICNMAKLWRQQYLPFCLENFSPIYSCAGTHTYYHHRRRRRQSIRKEIGLVCVWVWRHLADCII